jgi:hypothetical protein
VPVIIGATLLNATMVVPIILMFAADRLVTINLINLVFITGAAVFLKQALDHWGLFSGTAYIVLLNATWLLVAAPVIYRTVFRGGYRHWLFQDVAVPLIFGAIVFGGTTMLTLEGQSLGWRGILAISGGAICLVLMLAAMPQGRQQLLASIRFLVGKKEPSSS